MAMAATDNTIRTVQLTEETIPSFASAFFEFLRVQKQAEYADYKLPLEGTKYDNVVFSAKLKWMACDQDLALNDERVPTDYWLILLGSTIIGTAKTRYLMDDSVYHEGGHIRIGLAKEYRGKGYGTQVMRLLIEECVKNHHMHDLMISAALDNEAALGLIHRVQEEYYSSVQSKMEKSLDKKSMELLEQFLKAQGGWSYPYWVVDSWKYPGKAVMVTRIAV